MKISSWNDFTQKLVGMSPEEAEKLKDPSNGEKGRMAYELYHLLKEESQTPVETQPEIIAPESESEPEPENRLALGRLINDENTDGIIEYFSGDVERIAEKYWEEEAGIELQDLISEGTLALVEHISNRKLRATTIRTTATDAIEKAIRAASLSEAVERMNVIYNRKRAARVPVEQLETAYIRTRTGEEVNRALASLKPKHAAAVEMRYGLNGEPMKLATIAAELGLSQERVRQISRSSIEKLKAPPIGERLREYWGEGQEYEASNTEPQERELIDLLRQAERDIERTFGRTLDEFRGHYGLSQRDFVSFLTSIYPGLEKSSAGKLVKLTEAEMRKLREREVESLRQMSSIGSIKRTLEEYEDEARRIDSRMRVDIEARIKEIYFPLFAEDSERCLELLRTESRSPEHPQTLREMFNSAYDHFHRAATRKVEGLKTELDDYQKADLEILLELEEDGVIGSEMGTGKSLEAISYALARGTRRNLVVSTKSGAAYTWPRELRKHVEDPSVEVLDRIALGDPEFAEEPGWYVVSYGTATRYVEQIRNAGFDLIVLDECHKVNNPNTEQSRALTSLDSPHKLAVSGSLFKNRRSELFAMLNWMYPDDFPDRDAFEKIYCSDESGLYRLQHVLRGRMVARFKEQVLDLPPVVHSNDLVLMGGEDLERYGEMEADFVSWYERNKGNFKGGVGQAVLQKLHSLRQLAIPPKFPLVDEILAEAIGNEGKKIALYTTYVDPFEEAIERYAHYGVCAIKGRTNTSTRVAELNRFRDDPEKRLFVFTAAGGESVDLTPAEVIVYLNKPLTYADAKQALDRLHRRGQTKSVSAIHLVTAGTVDERVEELISRKRDEYERFAQKPTEFVKWFEEDRTANLRELVTSMTAERAY